MNEWHNIYITDFTGAKFFNTNASPMATASEIKNITRHLDAIKAGDASHKKVAVDRETAVLMLDGTPYGTTSIDDIICDELFAELFN